MTVGRKPDYRIAALNKVTDEKQARIGAAWANPDGSISLVFDPFVTVPVGRDFVITMFKDDKELGPKRKSKQDFKSAHGKEIPF